jgi:hypothetical protein
VDRDGRGVPDAVEIVLDRAVGREESRSVIPNRKKFSSPTSSRISTFAPSSVPIVNAPLSANFMLPVPEASLPASEICSDRSAAGMSFSAR